MKYLSVIICLICALTLCGDAVVVIKGKARRSSLKLEDRTGLAARARRYMGNMEIALRPRKKFQTAKVTFKVLTDDEFSFTVGGGYTRSEGSRKNDFEYVDCTLFRVNGKDLIGPKVEKGGQKSAHLFRPRAVKGSVKLKRGAKLVLELTLRSTPKKEARRLEAETDMTERDKMRLKREDDKDKARETEKLREEKERKAAAEANRRVLEKRYGIKESAKTQKTSASGEKKNLEKDEK